MIMASTDVTSTKILVADYMREQPFTIGVSIPLREALAMMADNDIRHLPVLHAGKLVGILSDRDANLVRFLPDGLNQKVEDVMSQSVYSVHPDTPLFEVTAKMAHEKYGAAVAINEEQKVVGIFTAIDALQILSEALKHGKIP